jgi:AAA domain/Bifunctional DNA primase/polymerase, N-terminal
MTTATARQTASPDILGAALAAHAAGLCVVPPKEDGSKRPDGLWQRYQSERPSEAQIRQQWGSGDRSGLGLVCGGVSGGLEMLELEGCAIAEGYSEKFIDGCRSVGIYGVVERIRDGYCETTPSGGFHFLYRCAETDGNLKLARRPATASELEQNPDDRIKVLIETRGEGGYTIVAPSHGTVHPTGKSWTLRYGAFATIATITPQERRALLDVAHSLDELPVASVPPPAPPRPVAVPATPVAALLNDDGAHWIDDVIDAYNAANPWPGPLGGGWQTHHTDSNGETYWTRAGKDPKCGHSATTNRNGNDRIIFFSSSVDPRFDVYDGAGPPTSYDRFSVYSILNHGGDRLAAARALRGDGYSQPPPSATASMNGKAPTAAPSKDEVTTVDGLFRVWPLGELLDADRTFRWALNGFMVDPTFGVLGGERKSLKSYIGMIVDLALASGQPAFGRFDVPRPRPILTYVGEGGRVQWTRRLERIGAAMGLSASDLRDLPIHPSFDVSPIVSPRFGESLRRDLDRYEPGLVNIDPCTPSTGRKATGPASTKKGTSSSPSTAPVSMPVHPCGSPTTSTSPGRATGSTGSPWSAPKNGPTPGGSCPTERKRTLTPGLSVCSLRSAPDNGAGPPGTSTSNSATSTRCSANTTETSDGASAGTRMSAPIAGPPKRRWRFSASSQTSRSS